jgi:hypothetical protein
VTSTTAAAGAGNPQPDPDQAWKALALVNDWVKHAESKAGATLAAAGVSGGVLYNLVKNTTDPEPVVDVVAVGCVIATATSGLLALFALVPQLEPPRGPRHGSVRWHAPLRRRQAPERHGAGISRAPTLPAAASSRAAPTADPTGSEGANGSMGSDGLGVGDLDGPDEAVIAHAAEDDPVNLLFFADIARYYAADGPSYADVLAALTSDAAHLTRHVTRQVHANALVAQRKYRLANQALRALGVALVLLAVTAAIVGHR